MDARPTAADAPPDQPWAAARALIDEHLDGMTYARQARLLERLPEPLPAVHEVGGLLTLAALALCETYGLLPPRRAEAVRAVFRDALARDAAGALRLRSPDEHLRWCTVAAEWCEREGLDLEYQRVAARATASDGAASVAARVHWRVAAAWHHEAFGRHRETGALMAEALALANSLGADRAASDLRITTALRHARLALWRHEPARALAIAEEAERGGDAARAPLWVADAADIRARVALTLGDFHGALQSARRAAAYGEAACAPGAHTLTYRLNEAYALAGIGAFDQAAALAAELAACRAPAHLQHRLGLLARLFRLVKIDAQGLPLDAACLAGVIGELRELDWPGVLALLPRPLARVWAQALEAGIERDWVVASIRSRRLAPPAPSWPDAWPWQVRLCVIGRSLCTVDAGVQTRVVDEGPRGGSRPLALLRRLAIEGGYDGVDAGVLAQALWPGEGRSGRDKALEVTLARLRRLLGHPEAVFMHQRRLRLNAEAVWLDLCALDAVLAQLHARSGSDEAAGREALWERLFVLWRGPLLDEEGDVAWLMPHRQRLRTRIGAVLLADAACAGHAARRLRAHAVDPLLVPSSDGSIG